MRKYTYTIDIDNSDKSFINRIMAKIMCLCENLITIKDVKPSSSKGYHLIIECSKKCDICRMVYDDFRRFAMDFFRPKYAQNVLFDKKEIYNAGELFGKK